MKNLESCTKKELINLIVKVRPKADAYDRVCEQLGIKKDILGYIKKLEGRPDKAKVILEDLYKTEVDITHNLGADKLLKYNNDYPRDLQNDLDYHRTMVGILRDILNKV